MMTEWPVWLFVTVLGGATSSLLVGVHGQIVDQTVQPGASGAGVVEAVCSLLEASCVFKEDKLLMRRMALVESSDGRSPSTFRSGYFGGIWQVDEVMFTTTQQMSVASLLASTINDIRRTFGIQWSTVKWSDLTKPLYSAIGARLYLQYASRTVPGGIPRPISDQGDFWVRFYRPSRNAKDFEALANSLEAVCARSNGADIVFVLDGSGSITPPNFVLIKNFVKEVVASFDVGPGEHQNRIGVIKYSNLAKTEFNLNTYQTKAQVISAIDAIRYEAGGTATDLALNEMTNVAFTSMNGARDKKNGHPRVGIVVTDGASNNPLATTVAANRSRAADITLFAVGVGAGINLAELNSIASDPVCQQVIILSEFKEFASLQSIIEKRTCDAPFFVTPNETQVFPLPRNTSINCQLKVTSLGVTIELLSSGGSASFYISYTTYPSINFYQHTVQSSPGRPGVLFVPQLGASNSNVAGTVFCSLKGSGNTETNVTVESKPDDTRCKVNPCKNGGRCIKDKEFTESCACSPGFLGSRCENVQTTIRWLTTRTPQTTTTTTAPCNPSNPCNSCSEHCGAVYEMCADGTRFYQSDCHRIAQSNRDTCQSVCSGNYAVCRSSFGGTVDGFRFCDTKDRKCSDDCRNNFNSSSGKCDKNYAERSDKCRNDFRSCFTKCFRG